MKGRFEGILTPTITPLDKKERIDELGFVKHLNRLIDNGVHGIYLLGTSGEFTTLTNAERQRAIEIAANTVGGRVPIICGVMDSSTQRVVQNIEIAQEFKIDAVAATPPYYYPSTSDADIVDFYKTIAQSTDLAGGYLQYPGDGEDCNPTGGRSRFSGGCGEYRRDQG